MQWLRSSGWHFCLCEHLGIYIYIIVHLVVVHLVGWSGDGGCHELSQNIWFDRLKFVHLVLVLVPVLVWTASLKNCGKVWKCVEKFENVCKSLKKCVKVWKSVKRLKKCGKFWKKCEKFEIVWKSLKKCGKVWKSLKKFRKSLKKFEKV